MGERIPTNVSEGWVDTLSVCEWEEHLYRKDIPGRKEGSSWKGGRGEKNSRGVDTAHGQGG